MLRNRASVNYAKFFRALCRKNYALDQKMNDTFFDGHDELYHHSKFGEDRTMRAGCRCENVVFVFVCLLVTLRVLSTVRSGVHSSNKHCVAVYCPFSISVFSQGIHYLVRIFVAWRRHNFREIVVANCENPKICGKVCAHHFV